MTQIVLAGTSDPEAYLGWRTPLNLDGIGHIEVAALLDIDTVIAILYSQASNSGQYCTIDRTFKLAFSLI